MLQEIMRIQHTHHLVLGNLYNNMYTAELPITTTMEPLPKIPNIATLTTLCSPCH